MSRKNRLRRVHQDPVPVKAMRPVPELTWAVAVITAVVVGMVAVGQMKVFG